MSAKTEGNPKPEIQKLRIRQRGNPEHFTPVPRWALTARLKTPSCVAAEVTRLRFLWDEKKESEPPHVGCYFFDRPLNFGFRTFFGLREFGIRIL
ncbi:MAG: hypothetical protein DME22_14955 [Verrucomicrobia bacterium]|nr:MAG: hypothetical protein DME22_14955 [Verrucomicrobiota bacterium]PYJ97989.1 MAG: hypothetical protein DME23_13315 [Verrucomicrobiota bacterium]